jgi:predicted SAM-dependent methyltransferase
MKLLKKIQIKLNSLSLKKIKFSDLPQITKVYLYAGDVPPMKEYREYIGLSLKQWNKNHIKHDVLKKYPIADNSIERYQSEDVFEHIEYEELPRVINEIFRVLKTGGLFRLSLPDYNCDILHERSQKDENGEIIFDSLGGGKFVDGKVINGGHVWFPTYIKVKELLEKTEFKNFTFLHYYQEMGKGITNTIDYSQGFVMRTPDNDDRVKNPYRPLSLVVDCIK